MTARRITVLAAALAAFSLPALAQQCGPSEIMAETLEANGWRTHDSMSAPAGFDYRLICNGPDGALVISGPNDLTCIMTERPIPGLCGLPPDADPPA
ncbi:MAG: hypothetical protein AAF414_17165 [Pseudomonadota bacterium]